MNEHRRGKLWLVRTLAFALVALSCAGCELYHNLGSGVRYDAPQDKPVSAKSKRVRDILLTVTTNAAGAVTQVQFKHSSGDADLDQYVADSVRTDWSGGPSILSTVALTYSGEKGFSQPKIISTAPAP